jgi:hypothetical protein
MGTVIEIDKSEAVHQRQLTQAYGRGQTARQHGISIELANTLCLTEFGLNAELREQFFDGYNDAGIQS